MYFKKKKHQFCPLNVSPDSLQSINTINVGFCESERAYTENSCSKHWYEVLPEELPGNMEELFKIVS